MKKEINNIHDKSYKALFSNKDIFLNLINDFTENEWKKQLTSDNLMLVNKSYILSDYEEIEADIVYRAEIDGQQVIFYVLLEFQSSVDHSMPIRLLLYMMEIWREVLKGVKNEEIKRKDYKLPAIVPIVTYNGKNTWNVPTHFRDKISNHELFGTKLLDFEYVLLDVNRYKKEELVEKESISSAIFLLDQKIGYTEYADRVATISRAFNKMSEEERLELRNWIGNTVSEDLKDGIFAILDSDKEEVDKVTANIYKTIEEMKESAKTEGIVEGKQEGIIQGKQEGIIQGKRESKLEMTGKLLLAGVDIDIIISTTGFTKEQIEELKKQL